jgi:hypothetical protein
LPDCSIDSLPLFRHNTGMTLSMRNAILLIGLGLNLLILILFGAGLSVIAPAAENAGGLISWFIGTYGGDLAFLLFLQLFSLLSVLVLYGSFRKTASPEIFFFLLFLLAVGMDGLRSLPPALRLLRMPIYLDQLVTRFLYLARFFGVFSLFTAGLFANGMQYQKLSIAFGIELLAAFTLASLLPVADIAQQDGGLPGYHHISDVMAVLLSLRVLSIINFTVAWIRNNNRDYLWLSLASLLVLLGNEALVRGENPFLRIGAGMALVSGTVLFARRTHEIYLWI